MSHSPVMCPRAAERAKRVKYDLMAVVVVYIEDGQRVAFYGHVLSDASGNPPQGKFGLCVRFGWSRRTWIAGAVDAMDDGDGSEYANRLACSHRQWLHARGDS